MEALKAVSTDDAPIDMARKSRQLGFRRTTAHIDIGGQRLTLLDELLLTEIADLL
jgi:hypothetical protein